MAGFIDSIEVITSMPPIADEQNLDESGLDIQAKSAYILSGRSRPRRRQNPRNDLFLQPLPLAPPPDRVCVTEAVADCVYEACEAQMPPDSPQAPSYFERLGHDMGATEVFHAAWGSRLHIGRFETPGQSVPDAAARTERVIAEQMAPKTGSCVLEVGCGFGSAARLLACDYGCKVVATDAEQWRLDRAVHMSSGIDGITFECADHCALPYEDDAFDLVLALETLVYSRDLTQSLSEIARVLKPGGRVAILDWRGTELLDPRPILALNGGRNLWSVRKWRSIIETFNLTIDVFEDWTLSARETYIKLATSFQSMESERTVAAKAAENMNRRVVWIDRNAFGSVFISARKNA